MEITNPYYALVIAGVFLSSCSQLLLKKSADTNHDGIISNLMNWRVIIAYTVFLGSLLINITAMHKGVLLKDIPILESLGYVFVPLLSWMILKEKATKRTVICILLILCGIYIFYQ